METLHNPANLAGYRLEMIVTNTVHLLILMILALCMAVIALFADFTGRKQWFTLLPLMTLAIIGLVIRMGTEIHRMGRSLLFMGDYREAFKRADPASNLIPMGDVCCLILVLALTVYAEIQVWEYLSVRFGHFGTIKSCQRRGTGSTPHQIPQ